MRYILHSILYTLYFIFITLYLARKYKISDKTLIDSTVHRKMKTVAILLAVAFSPSVAVIRSCTRLLYVKYLQI